MIYFFIGINKRTGQSAIITSINTKVSKDTKKRFDTIRGPYKSYKKAEAVMQAVKKAINNI